jgi:DNA-directed RNA polymerase specialized sigma24 family protein
MTKETLERYADATERIREINREIRNLSYEANRIDGYSRNTGCDKPPRNGIISNPTLNACVSNIDGRDIQKIKLQHELDTLLDLERDVLAWMQSLTIYQIEVIDRRHILGLSWERIADSMGKCIQTVINWYNQAVEV